MKEEMYPRPVTGSISNSMQADADREARKEDRTAPIFIPYSWIRWIGIAAFGVSAPAMDWESILLPVLSFSLLPTFEY